ncbi:MAG: ABC transporter substrate-binding protein [Alphaproteobacteria bacterium]|nr:ABC transporter substrate-binding protein [Alphaproteobacteria bacterium]
MTKKTRKSQISRRTFVAGAGTAAVATGVIGFPAVLRAAPQPVNLGIIHPVTGFLQQAGAQCRFGAMLAVADINADGGIRSLDGAKVRAQLGDAQSKAEIGVAEVEKLNERGVSAIVGCFASGISIATTQAAAKHGIPHVVDVGVSDKIVQRGLKNTFRFGPGFGKIVKVGTERLIEINEKAGKPTKSLLIVHENSTPFGSGMAKLLTKGLGDAGFDVMDALAHPTPNRDFNNIVLKIKAANPDLVVPSMYYNEYVLFARTLERQKVKPKAIYSVLGGAASQYKFLKEFPTAAQYIMDCNHWYNPKNSDAFRVRAATEKAGKFYSYEVFTAYHAVKLVADAIERAKSRDRAAIIDALASSTWAGHFMPYGPTKFVNGQNQGAQPLNTQILGDEIEVIAPEEYATAKAVFPRPA